MTYPAVTPRGGRRAEMLRRRRRQRRRLGLVGVALLVVLAVVVTVVLATTGGDRGAKVAVPGRTQQTVLLQVRGTNGSAELSALLAHDPGSQSGSVVLLPPEVFVTTASGGSTTLGTSLRTAGVAGSRNALSDLVGVTVDGSWVLDSTAFQRLVDQENGITVDVDVPVTAGRVVQLQAGKQHLNGRQALQFATFLAAGEQEQSRLARFQTVLDGVIDELPAQPGSLIGSLGAGSTVDYPAGKLDALVSGLKSDDTATDLQYRTLPVVPIDDGSGQTDFRLDPTGSTALVNDLLAASVPTGARSGHNRVLVLNGVGPGIGTKARALLVPAGFVFVGAQNADHFGYATSQVLVPDTSAASADLGSKVAAALHLPDTDVRASSSLGTLADVVVLVGADFKG